MELRGGTRRPMAFPGLTVFNGVAPVAYTDINLATLVGTRVVLAYLQINNNAGDASALTYSFREDGEARDYYGGAAGEVGGVPDGDSTYLLVITSAWAIVEWRAGLAKQTQVFLKWWVALT